jgi:hypothetical protein
MHLQRCLSLVIFRMSDNLTKSASDHDSTCGPMPRLFRVPGTLVVPACSAVLLNRPRALAVCSLPATVAQRQVWTAPPDGKGGPGRSSLSLALACHSFQQIRLMTVS